MMEKVLALSILIIVYALILSKRVHRTTAVLLTMILWVSALLSMFLDNVPFAAAMVPVLRDLAAAGIAPLPPITWSTAIGADVGGNATPIGASANVVGLAIAEKHGIHIGWREYMRTALPAMLLSILAANILLVILFR